MELISIFSVLASIARSAVGIIKDLRDMAKSSPKDEKGQKNGFCAKDKDTTSKD